MSERGSAYAEALLGIAVAEGQTERVEDELFRIARTLESSDELRKALGDQMIPVERRQGIVEDLLKGKASALTVAIVDFLVAAGRVRELPAIADSFVERAAARRSQAVAEVRSAIPLDQAQQARLAEALGRATGKTVSVKVVVDPTVLGGIVARVGDTVIDGSVRTRLEQMKEHA